MLKPDYVNGSLKYIPRHYWSNPSKQMLSLMTITTMEDKSRHVPDNQVFLYIFYKNTNFQMKL